MPDELRVAPLPASCMPVWEAFCELHSSRMGGMGATAISFSELAHWQAVRGVRLTPWEVDTIKALDMTALKALSDQRAAQESKL